MPLLLNEIADELEIDVVLVGLFGRKHE